MYNLIQIKYNFTLFLKIENEYLKRLEKPLVYFSFLSLKLLVEIIFLCLLLFAISECMIFGMISKNKK